MAIQQGLYAKVVKISRKDIKIIAENDNKNEAKFKFQGQSAISQRLFDVDFVWIEVNFCTRELDLYEKLIQRHGNTRDKNSFQFFQVPTGNSKCVEKF